MQDNLNDYLVAISYIQEKSARLDADQRIQMEKEFISLGAHLTNYFEQKETKEPATAFSFETLQWIYTLALEQFNQSDFVLAGQLLKFLITLSPMIPEALALLGRCHHQLGLYDSALELYQASIELDPQAEEPQFWRAEALKVRGEL